MRGRIAALNVRQFVLQHQAAAVVGGGKPSAYPFLESLAACTADQISIEAAQPRKISVTQ